MTSEYFAVYTDDSNDGGRLALAAVFRQQVYSLRLPSASSIFNAEVNAIFHALKFVASTDESISMILVLACWQLRVVILKTLSF